MGFKARKCNMFTATWDAVEDATGYNLYWSSLEGSGSRGVPPRKVSIFRRIYNSLIGPVVRYFRPRKVVTPNTTYYYTVTTTQKE